jgi:hypothetical protein
MSRRPIKPALEHPPVSANLQQQQHQQQQQQQQQQQGVPQDDAKDMMLHDLSQHVIDDGTGTLISPTTPTTKKRKAKPGPATGAVAGGAGSSAAGVTNKRPRTNTPWTPAEEQRLKTMRDAGNSWSEIAKTFPTRTEGSVKKHWYKV